jgi:hypothetical protein
MEEATSILMMESKVFFDTAICLHQNKRLHIPDFSNLPKHSSGNLESLISVLSSHERQILQVVSSHDIFGYKSLISIFPFVLQVQKVP